MFCFLSLVSFFNIVCVIQYIPCIHFKLSDVCNGTSRCTLNIYIDNLIDWLIDWFSDNDYQNAKYQKDKVSLIPLFLLLRKHKNIVTILY